MNERGVSCIKAFKSKAERPTKTEEAIMDIYGMQKAVPLVAPRGHISIDEMLLRRVYANLRRGAALLGLLASVYSPCAGDSGYNVVQISTAAPVGTQAAFLSAISGQFNASVVPNPLASNTYAIKIFGPQAGQQLQADSLDSCISQGFSDGMDSERQSEMNSIESLEIIDASSGTCAGIVVDSTTETDCQYIYGLILNNINQRWDTVFNSTGGVVAP